MDALDALDAVGESNVQLVRQVGSGQWDGATPCTEWNVRSLVGHLIMGRHVYRGFLEGVPVAELRLILQQGGAAGDDPVAACESAVRSIRAAFAQPGALERTVHHTIGDMPGRQLLVQLVADCVVHSWDLATAIGVDPGLDEQLIELSYEFYLPLMQKDAVYAYGWFKPPASPLPEGATPRWSGSSISWAADSLSADSHQRTGRLGCPGCKGRGSLAPADSARPFSQLAESTKP